MAAKFIGASDPTGEEKLKHWVAAGQIQEPTQPNTICIISNPHKVFSVLMCRECLFFCAPQEFYVDGVPFCSHRSVAAGVENGSATQAIIDKAYKKWKSLYSMMSLD